MIRKLKLKSYITFIIIMNIEKERVSIIRSYSDIFNIAVIKTLRTMLRSIRNVNLKL